MFFSRPLTRNIHNFCPCFLYDGNDSIFVVLVYSGENKKSMMMWTNSVG